MAGLSVSLALLPGTARATTGPCLPERLKPDCHVSTGKVKRVNDGDTLDVAIRGDGRPRALKVRLAGIQAMELRRYSRTRRAGECTAVAATRTLERLVRGSRRRVRLSSLHAGTRGGPRHRLRRSVAVRRGGRWVDAGAVLLRAGLALWLPSGREWAPNRTYSRLSARAARRGRGLWSTRSCGRGPAQSAHLEMRLKWDAFGRDNDNVNGEWVRITSAEGSPAISLRGWWLRDSSLRRFRFPASATIPPGESIWVLVGSGEATPTRLYWGQPRSVFQNATGGVRAVGDGAYLFDPDGDLRSWVQYPCRVRCHEPLAGRLSLSGSFWNPEYVTIRNVSDSEVSLWDYELESAPWFYRFGSDAVLPPGGALVLWIGGGSRRPPVRSVSVVKAWGSPRNLLSRRDAVTLRNPLGAPVICDSWGGAGCPAA